MFGRITDAIGIPKSVVSGGAVGLVGWAVTSLQAVLPSAIFNSAAMASVGAAGPWIVGGAAAFWLYDKGSNYFSYKAGQNDEKNKRTKEHVEKNIEAGKYSTNNPPNSIEEIENLLREAAQNGILNSDRIEFFIQSLRKGTLSVEQAWKILQRAKKESANPLNGDLKTTTGARAFTVINKSETQQTEPSVSYVQTMQSRFGIAKNSAIELYRDAPIDPTARVSLQQMLTDDVINLAFVALEETARSMAVGQSTFVRVQEFEVELENKFNQQMNGTDIAGDEFDKAMNRL